MQKHQTFRTDNNYAVKTCKRLRAFREETGFAASAVAEHLQIPTDLYVMYEEHWLVAHQLIPALCEFLNLSPWYYLTGLPDKLSPPFRSEKDKPYGST